MTARTYVVGGSGPSLRSTDPARVPASATVVRVNNFFLEPEYFLGRRVDCAYFSADPRAVRFYIATLRQVIERGEYDVRRTASHLTTARRHHPPKPFTAVDHAGTEVGRLLSAIEREEGARPTSGVMAMLHARRLGANRILLAGIDFYTGPKYVVDIPPTLARVLEPNFSPQGYDVPLHTLAADRRALDWLREQGVAVEATSEEAAAGMDLPLAPRQPDGDRLGGTGPKGVRYTDDWVSRAGVWTVGGLALARAVRRRIPRRATNRAGERP